MSDTTLPVFLRFKPQDPESSALPFLSVLPDSKRVVVEPPKESRFKAKETFSFNGVYTEHNNHMDIYKGTVLPLVENVVKHHSDSLLFSMGASGSGKTHTILGSKQSPGMVHLALDTIFRSVDGRTADFEMMEMISDKNPSRTSQGIEAGLILDWTKETKPVKKQGASESAPRGPTPRSVSGGCKFIVPDKFKYAVYISMVEIYNDRIFDLFDDSNPTVSSANNHRKALLMKTDAETGKVYLADVRKVFVSDKAEAFRTVEHGLSLRAAHATGSNIQSSRSHAFVIIDVKRVSGTNRTARVSSATLTIADLAGSERVKTSKTNGTRLVESCAINKSLMLLGQCLQKQRDQNDLTQKESVALRNSKLTQLLLSNAFNSKLDQKSALLINVDRYGDFNTASQILRYSALARDVTLPKTRVPSASSVSSTSTLADEEVEEPVSPALLDGMQKRILELEAELAASREECLAVEEQVRQEMADLMDTQINELQKQFKQQMTAESDRGRNLTDQKLELMKQVEQVNPEDYMALVVENDQLRNENLSLRLEGAQPMRIGSAYATRV